ncbi:hypothetical protein [Citrobacter amalonaticus]|uniref:Uncharacterized protein n=2 Tax=Enterobacteriaceae TaxID=543 RepID=A0AAX2BEP5_CITAM|nr:hypothetical protein [Citrobacter amalonaticus]ECG1391441.1 hypothetical protein [Salmonella enterica subsp. houtenae str. CFSAN000557]SAZ05521.1 conserved protein of unknown function [Citrobacter amalonaticus]HAE7766816.1 hypothetical protein [Salmonella enterica subsp. houtenae serovar 45:g,z51:-]HEM7399218.1 hypothetical protein [Citrobacter farmeri]
MDRNTPFKDGELFAVPVAAATEHFGGHIVAANAGGYAVPGSATAANTTLGVCDGWVDNSAGVNGENSVLVRRGKSWCLANSSADPVTQSQVGKDCYVEDSTTVAKTSNADARPVAGTVLGVDAEGVWVLI